MHQSQHVRVLVPLLLILTIVGVALVPLTAISPSTEGQSHDSFAAFMYPRLLALSDTVETVESLVSERSRNILALQANAQRIETLVSQIDKYLSTSGYPQSFDPIVEHYRTGRTAVLSAIDGARTSLRSFDFSILPTLITQFDHGTRELEQALAMLEAV